MTFVVLFDAFMTATGGLIQHVRKGLEGFNVRVTMVRLAYTCNTRKQIILKAAAFGATYQHRTKFCGIWYRLLHVSRSMSF